MGTRLRRLKAQLKGQILSDGKCLSGKNPLTEHEIDNLQSYYGSAIRRNHSSVQNMRQAIWAIFLHKLSTDEYPQHGFCPIGEDSWCGFKRLKHQYKFNLYGSDGQFKIWREAGKSLAPKNTIKTVKFGGGSVLVWGCMSAGRLGELAFIDGIMDKHVYLGILKDNLEKVPISFTPNAGVLFVDVDIQPEVRFIAKQNSLMKIGNNGNLVRRIDALLDDRFDELPNQTENKSLDSC
ncbi:uncharacterized protein TNCV_4853021 [Trichonephila clavipes]|nr:uncharacterized protein TNCV_4853021 [Trichonephila clavipes]